MLTNANSLFLPRLLLLSLLTTTTTNDNNTTIAATSVVAATAASYSASVISVSYDILAVIMATNANIHKCYNYYYCY